MSENSTPLSAFHPPVRAILDDEDQEKHTAYLLTEKIKAVLQLGKVPGHKITADNSSVEPALTPASDQDSYNLLIYHAALMFRRSLTNGQISAIERAIEQVEPRVYS